MNLSYILNELGEEREKYFNAIAPPIMASSNAAFKTVADFREAILQEQENFVYSRGNNPTVEILCKKLAALDAAEDALVFSSGSAAIFAAVLAHVKAGDHIVSVRNPYTWAQKLFNVILPRFAVTTTYIDGSAIENFERAILPNTTLIYLESPNSWTYELQDLAAVAALAKAENIVSICDNSYCTPLYQQPIAVGIDLCLQSASKYIGGHSDVVAGVLSGNKEIIAKIFNSEFMTIGSGISPFNAWLLLRGLRTLPMRLAHISNNTKQIVAYLQQHPKVAKVIFPFADDFPQITLAKQQMSGAAGLLTFLLKATEIFEIERFCNALKHILLAVSWGGYESLIMPKCCGMPAEDFNAKNPQHCMIRMYVGLEEPAYLIEDLERGFNALS